MRFGFLVMLALRQVGSCHELAKGYVFFFLLLPFLFGLFTLCLFNVALFLW